MLTENKNMSTSMELSKSRDNYAAAWLTEEMGESIRRLAKSVHAPRSVAIRMAIDAGLKQLDPEYVVR